MMAIMMSSDSSSMSRMLVRGNGVQEAAHPVCSPRAMLFPSTSSSTASSSPSLSAPSPSSSSSYATNNASCHKSSDNDDDDDDNDADDADAGNTVAQFRLTKPCLFGFYGTNALHITSYIHNKTNHLHPFPTQSYYPLLPPFITTTPGTTVVPLFFISKPSLFTIF